MDVDRTLRRVSTGFRVLQLGGRGGAENDRTVQQRFATGVVSKDGRPLETERVFASRDDCFVAFDNRSEKNKQ